MKIFKYLKTNKLNSLAKQSSIVAICTIISRITGYLREIVQTTWMGASAATDAIIIATRISTLLRKTSSEGSINSALIPIMSDLDEQKQSETKNSLINFIILTFSTIFIIFNIIYLVYPSSILSILSLGQADGSQTTTWIKAYLPYTNATIVLFFLYGIFSAVLNYKQNFFWPSIAPAIWNIILVILIIFANKTNASYSVFGPILLIATAVQTLITLIAYSKLKIKFKINPTPELKAAIKMFFKKFFPIMFATSVAQINSIIVITIAAAYLAPGSATLLFRAEKLLQIPIVLTIPFTTTLLPALSKATSNYKQIKKTTLYISSLISLMLTIFFYIYGPQVISLFFKYGKTTVQDIEIMSNLFAIYTLAIPAYFFMRILPIFFYAKKKTKHPTIAALLNATINTVLSLILIKKIGITGLAIAGTISAYVHVIFLYISLKTHKD